MYVLTLPQVFYQGLSDALNKIPAKFLFSVYNVICRCLSLSSFYSPSYFPLKKLRKYNKCKRLLHIYGLYYCSTNRLCWKLLLLNHIGEVIAFARVSVQASRSFPFKCYFGCYSNICTTFIELPFLHCSQEFFDMIWNAHIQVYEFIAVFIPIELDVIELRKDLIFNIINTLVSFGSNFIKTK